jgi:hypothetical protein
MNSFRSFGDLAADIVDRWSWWRAALNGDFGQASESHPEQGYYRTRRKNGQWEAVAIFYPEGSDRLVAYRGGREVEDINSLWVWCLRYPITFEAYEKAMAGGGFDDEPPAPIGDNSSDADPFEALRLEFIGEKEQADEILKTGIKTQADADRASIWKDRFLKIRSRAQAMFKTEKQPVLDEGKRIDEKFRALAHEKDSEPSAMIEKLRLGMEAFLREQKRVETERQRKAQEEADRARRAAEEAARAVRQAVLESGQAAIAANAEAQRLAAQAAAAAREAEARKVSAGRTGARTTIRTEKLGVVTDYGKAAAALVAMKHRDLLAEIDRLAQRAAKAGLGFDGMEIREEERII